MPRDDIFINTDLNQIRSQQRKENSRDGRETDDNHRFPVRPEVPGKTGKVLPVKRPSLVFLIFLENQAAVGVYLDRFHYKPSSPRRSSSSGLSTCFNWISWRRR